VHGGLRYLEQREFGLVREASVERGLLGRLAPHLVEALPFVIPVSDRWLRAKFGVGIWAYDALASFRNMSMHRYVDADTVKTLVPALAAVGRASEGCGAATSTSIPRPTTCAWSWRSWSKPYA